MVELKVVYKRDDYLSEIGKTTLKDRYMLPSEESPQEAFARAALAFADDTAHAQRIYDYVSKRWFMFSTPILSNGGTDKGLPISCFLEYTPDSRKGLLDHYAEAAWLSSYGGGLGGFWGHVRGNGASIRNGSGTSTGVIPFLKVMDSQVLAFSQGSSRRGSYAAYLDISHPEITEFLHMRKPTGGDMNRKSLNLHHAVVIPDSFMEAVENGDMWNLIDPHSKEITGQVDARSLWQSILNLRVETGEPYIMWSDACNNALPDPVKNLGLKVHQSNLCSEIILPTNEERTAVCCLSSVNLEFFEHWAGTEMVADIVRFLDNVLQYFIDNAPDTMSKAKYSAMRGRDIGLGAMGFHSFLQSKNIPFESVMAKVWNKKMFKYIKAEAVKESIKLGLERGFAPDLCQNISKSKRGKVVPQRNSHLLAVAPNASSSIICSTSPSIEPIRANIFTQKTLSGSFEMKNPFLVARLQELGMDTKEVWKSITANRGSVQHLEFLTDHDKLVFKTADEIDQMWVIEHAVDRQEYICQAQSVNLFFTPIDGKIPAKYLHDVHFKAWKGGLKTLYYLRSQASKRVENVNVKVERNNLVDTQAYTPVYEETTCLSCE